MSLVCFRHTPRHFCHSGTKMPRGGNALKRWPSATSWAGTLGGGPSWASGAITTVAMAGSRHLSGAAPCCLWGVFIHWLLLAAARGMAFTDPHFPDGETGPLHVREGRSF